MWFHITLEKSIAKRLQTIAKKRSKSVNKILRELLEVFVGGKILNRQEPLDDVLKQIQVFRDKRPQLRSRSLKIIRDLRKHEK